MTREQVAAILTEIGVYYERPYNSVQRDAMITRFVGESADVLREAWERYKSTAQVERRPSQGQLEQLCHEVRESRYAATKSNAKTDAVLDKGEALLWARLLSEIYTWHRAPSLRMRVQQASRAGIVDYEGWLAAGKPRTWSKMLDYVFDGLECLWHDDQARKDWLLQCYNKFRDQRVAAGGVPSSADAGDPSAAAPSSLRHVLDV